MDLDAVTKWILENGIETFSRSSGPGGQHVNKTSTAIVCHVDLHRLAGVSEGERARLFEKLKNRINAEGELFLRAQDSRSQLTNRTLVLERMVGLIVQALHREKPRRATKPTRASKERRLLGKKQTADHKRNRSRPSAE